MRYLGDPLNGLSDPLLGKINWNAAVQYYPIKCLLFLCNTYNNRQPSVRFLERLVYYCTVLGTLYVGSEGVRHDPQRFMGRNVTVAHFNPDTISYTSPGSIYSESKHGNQNTASFSEKRYR